MSLNMDLYRSSCPHMLMFPCESVVVFCKGTGGWLCPESADSRSIHWGLRGKQKRRQRAMSSLASLLWGLSNKPLVLVVSHQAVFTRCILFSTLKLYQVVGCASADPLTGFPSSRGDMGNISVLNNHICYSSSVAGESISNQMNIFPVQELRLVPSVIWKIWNFSEANKPCREMNE